jgi:tape measure domain-containing protein
VSVVANVAINVDSSGAVSKLRQVQTQATATQRAFGALQSAIAGIGVASIAAQTLKAAASFNDLQTRLKLLTSEYGEYTQAQQFAAKAAKQFGLSNREAATGVADIYARLRPLGVSLKDIQSTFNGFNTIARLSGVSAAGASSAFLQLGQALGSGRLQGDEFRSIAEQIPGLLVAVSKETGIAAKDLKKFASDGKLSADIVINALKRIESEGAGKIAALVRNSDTQKFKDLENAVDDLSVAVGNELLPVVTPLIKDLTSLVGTIAALPDPVKNATGEIVKLIIQLVLVEKAIKAIIALRLGFIGAMVGMTGATVASGAAAKTSAGAFALYTNNTRALQAQAATATPVLTGLKNVLSTIAAIGVITVAVNIAVSGFQSLLVANAELAKLRGRKSEGGAAAMFAGSTKEEVARQQEIARKTKKHEEKTLAGLQSPGSRIAQFVNLGGVLEGLGVPSIGSASRRGMQARARIGSAEAVLGLDPNKFPSATPTFTPTTAGGGGDATGRKKGKNDGERAAEEKRRAAEELANLQEQVTLKEKLFGIDKQIAVEKQRGSLVTAAALEMDKALEERQTRIAEITRSTADTATKNAQIKDATLDADQKIYAVQQAIKEQEAERIKSFDEIIADLDLQLKLKTATTEQEREQLRIAAERAKLEAQLKGLPQPQIDQAIALQAQVAAPLTDVQKIDQHIGKLKTEIADLTSLSNIAITSAEGIGNAFAQSFQGLISGTMTAKEALGSFFKSVADMFLEMAAQIIAKQITMIILQTILKALGAVAGGGGGGGNAASALGSNPNVAAYAPLAKGGTFGNGVAAFAKGGTFSNSIVSSPTLFKFADGGTTRTGLMGEAGPEAIMPLKRGADGSLGVQATGLREAMGRPPGGAGGSPVLNMSFQSTSINGVEYVSRDQLESAMAETRRASTRDGAKRGMTMTLDRIQNSSSTRRKVGI